MVQVSSDPYAHLRPIFRGLSVVPGFALLPPAVRFEHLVQAVALLSGSDAARLRQFTPEAQRALVRHLAKAEVERPGPSQVALWAAQKAQRRRGCFAVYLASGVDVRLMEEDQIIRTELAPDGPSALQVAGRWRVAAIRRGWSVQI